jgi:hypothetical protein
MPALDAYANVNGLTDQGREASVVVPAGTDLTRYPKALWINAAGTLTGIPVDGSSTVDFTVAAGVFDAVRFKRITAAPANTIAIF